MVVNEAGLRRVTNGHTLSDDNDSDDVETDDDESGDEVNSSNEATVIDLVIVQPKSLQKCRIIYEDALQSMPESFFQPLKIKEEPKEDKNGASSMNEAASKISLMSPEVFKVKEEPKDLDQDQQQQQLNVLIKSEPRDVDDEVVVEVKPGIRSGGSSPSREVQDILGDSEEQGGLGSEIVITEEPFDEDDEDEDEFDEASENIVDVDDDEDRDLSLAAKAALNLTNDPIEVKKEMFDWPGVPQVKSEPAQHQQQQQPQQQSDASSLIMLQKMEEMAVILRQQHQEVLSLKAEVQTLRRQQQQQPQQQQQQPQLNVDKLVKKVEQQFGESLKKDSRVRNEFLLAGLTQNLSGSMAGKIDSGIRQEMKKQLPQLIQQSLQGLSASLEQDVRQRNAKNEAALRDAVAKMVHSKQTVEAVGQAVANALQSVVQAAFKENFVKVGLLLLNIPVKYRFNEWPQFLNLRLFMLKPLDIG